MDRLTGVVDEPWPCLGGCRLVRLTVDATDRRRSQMHSLLLPSDCVSVPFSFVPDHSQTHIKPPLTIEMVEESPHLRAQRLAHQVWQLPHFRLSVFERLVTLRKRKSKFAGDDASLKQYLTLDKASFREVAMLLYPCIDLDSFPWDCPSQV